MKAQALEQRTAGSGGFSIAALVLALTLLTSVAHAQPLPATARGKGTLSVSGDGRFGLFASNKELVTWEIDGGPKKFRVKMPSREPWSLWPSPDGEMLVMTTPTRVAEVMLLTGRVVFDLTSSASSGPREVAWKPDSKEVLLLGWELPELMAGDGTPIAYFDPRLGFAARQIRVPGMSETRGMATLANGLDVVVARSKDLMVLGLGVASVRTVPLGPLAGATLIASAPDGLVVHHGDAVHVIDSESAKILRTLKLPDASAAWRFEARQAGRWLVASVDKPRVLVALDVVGQRVSPLDVMTLGKTAVVLPLADRLVSVAKDVQFMRP